MSVVATRFSDGVLEGGGRLSVGRTVDTPGAAEAGDPYRDLQPRFRPGGEAVPAKSSAIRLACLLGPDRWSVGCLPPIGGDPTTAASMTGVGPSLTADAQRQENIGSARKKSQQSVGSRVFASI
ncbi:hypothetical protein [Streptomyces sp. NPDC102283]|uniref:hypothetical protein n=1 Tax=Streptomyces sp. NPDC102283 TaxID=3366155 RepID=UPI00381514B1